MRGGLLSPGHDRLLEAGFDDISVIPVDEHAFAFDYTNWRVTGQHPAAGEVPTDTTIRLEVVKIDDESDLCLGDC